MSAEYTNLVKVPGIRGRLVIDADYDWDVLGGLLIDSIDFEQAEFLEALSVGLRDLPNSGGIMQLQSVVDTILRDDAEYDIEAIKWFLRELLCRLG